MGCRVCLEDCDEPLRCKCAGYAHVVCMRDWIRARLRRGDHIEDVFYCEVCNASCLGTAPLTCSWLHFRIIAMRVVMLAAVITGGANVIILILPDVWGPMVGLMMIIMFIMIYVTLRLLDRHCVNACLCSDVVYLEV